jgi:hypothetical protein
MLLLVRLMGLGLPSFSLWELVRGKYLAMFLDFHKGELDIRRLNYGVITLLPKV